MAVRRPDSIPHWQVTADGYESPTEATFEELRHIYPLTEWIQRDPDRAAKVLGKNNTKLRLPEVRRVVWQLRIRHTNFQLRAIWKYCNERCWELAPYAFNADKRPYEEFKWVVYPTKARFGDDAARAISEQPVPAVPSAANTVNRTGWLNNHPPPNAPRGPRGGLQRPIPHPFNVSRPAPNASAAAPGSGNYASHTRQPVTTPATHMTSQNGRSMQKGKAPIRSGEASFDSAPRALPLTPASVSYAQRAPDTVHPSRRPFIDTTSTRNALARDQTFAQTHPDRARLLEAPMNNWPTPKSGPSQAPKSMPIRSSVPRTSESASQSDIERAGQYTPTPGLSSRINHSSANPTIDARSLCRSDIKTPRRTKNKNQAASSELGSPSLHSNVNPLPPVGAQPHVVPQTSRAAGKQPVRSDVSPINASSSSAPRAQTTTQDQRCKCPKRHPGECRPLCNRCSERHIGLCRDVACSTCDKRHKGACWGVCSACNKRHGGICQVRSRARAEDASSPKAAAKQDQAPKTAEQSGTAILSAPEITSDNASVEMADNEAPQCKHRLKDKDCMNCECGCGECHRPGKLCWKRTIENREKTAKQIEDQTKAAKQIQDQQEATKQTEDQKKAAKKIKDQKKAAKKIKDQKKAAKETKSQKKAGKKRKADDDDDADETNVKVEESSSQSMLLSQPKKKRKKQTEAKAKAKTNKEKREGPVDSKGMWYNPIPVPD